MASEMRSALKVKTPGRAAEDVDPTRLKLLDTAETLFARHGIRPFFNQGTFEPEALSRYFLEMTA